jgi:hypothetical protein
MFKDIVFKQQATTKRFIQITYELLYLDIEEQGWVHWLVHWACWKASFILLHELWATNYLQVSKAGQVIGSFWIFKNKNLMEWQTTYLKKGCHLISVKELS